MNEKSDKTEHEEWEMRVQKTSRHFEFPKTPRIADAVQKELRPKPAYILRPAAALLLLLLLGILFSVPQIRASVLDYIQLGAGNFLMVPDMTPFPTLAVAQLDAGIEMSLEEAEAIVDYPLNPPSELGRPAVVYLQEARLPMVILVWYEPEGFTASRILLYVIDSRDTFFKFAPDEPENLTIHGRQAFWFTGPHLLEFIEVSSQHLSRQVEGNVLVWEVNNLTYRLEGEMSVEEALRIAESVP